MAFHPNPEMGGCSNQERNKEPVKGRRDLNPCRLVPKPMFLTTLHRCVPRAVVRGEVQSGNGQDSLACRKGMDRGGSPEMDTLGCPRGHQDFELRRTFLRGAHPRSPRSLELRLLRMTTRNVVNTVSTYVRETKVSTHERKLFHVSCTHGIVSASA